MSKTPFFSIIIPTYNNAHFLEAAIAICLKQTFKDFEIVVVDDCSPDDTKSVVGSIKDKRVRYIRNKKNLGQEGNFKKSFSLGRGKYLFISGDDDYMLWPDTLERIHKEIKRGGYGFVRLNLLERQFRGRKLRKSIISYEKDTVIKKDFPPEKILEIFRKIAVGHMAGLVFKNEKNIGKKLFDLQETPWIRILYEAVRKDGGLYLSSHYMVITWSQRAIFSHYDVRDGKSIMIDDYMRYTTGLLPVKDQAEYKRQFYSSFALLQPVIKLYSNNANLLAFNKMLFKRDASLRRNKKLWVMLPVALLLPKVFWNLVRKVQHTQKNHVKKIKNLSRVQARFQELEEKYIYNLEES